MVATQAQNALQSKCICSTPLTGDMPHCSKPQNQRLTGAIKKGTGCNGTLDTALPAMKQVSICQPGPFVSAVWTGKTARPLDATPITAAIALVAESFLKFHQGSWGVFVHAANPTASNRWNQLCTPINDT